MVNDLHLETLTLLVVNSRLIVYKILFFTPFLWYSVPELCNAKVLCSVNYFMNRAIFYNFLFITNFRLLVYCLKQNAGNLPSCKRSFKSRWKRVVPSKRRNTRNKSFWWPQRKFENFLKIYILKRIVNKRNILTSIPEPSSVETIKFSLFSRRIQAQHDHLDKEYREHALGALISANSRGLGKVGCFFIRNYYLFMQLEWLSFIIIQQCKNYAGNCYEQFCI